MSIDEIVERAIPINMSCQLERQKAIRRRELLKQRIKELIEDVKNKCEQRMDDRAY